MDRQDDGGQPPEKVEFTYSKLDVPQRLIASLALHELDLNKIDDLDANALKSAIRSVMRSPDSVALHQDHRSHSNT